jgi:hypothetical protein
MVADWFVKKTGRTSIFVWVLVFMFALSCVIIPISSSGELKEDIQGGKDIWGFTNFCNK